jgi:hypothetical protein
VFKLGKHFKMLETLIISENKLCDLELVKLESIDLLIKESFANLNTISLNKLNIKKWKTVEFIRLFPSLKNIRIQNIPLLDKYNLDERYFLIVSNLNEQLLETLNGSKVTNEDILKCQRKFLSFYMDLSIKPARFYDLKNKQTNK